MNKKSVKSDKEKAAEKPQSKVSHASSESGHANPQKRPVIDPDDDPNGVDEASRESFPASDPPARNVSKV